MALPPVDHLRLRALVLIETLAQSGSLHQAARRLNTSQPSLTVMLRDFERTMGGALFERSRRGLAPTPMGDYAIQQARLILADLRRVQSEFAAGQQGRNLLRVGVLQLLMLEIVPRALVLLRQSTSAVRIEFEEGAAGDLLARLADGALDMVVGRMLPDFAGNEDLEVSLLLSQSFCIISGAHHPLARRRKLSWLELQATDWLQAPPNTALHGYFVEAFLRQGLTPPQPLYQSASFHTCVTILESSDCLMMVPDEVARHFARHASIRILPVRLEEPSTPFSIVRRRSRADMAGMKAFENAVRQVVDNRPRSGVAGTRRAVGNIGPGPAAVSRARHRTR
ncbi:MAG: LysR family transcriptional regulator [Enhydrobacter sp.]|nr:LysR family transcriptional regulator [Enhydrobacter sp.]